MVSNAIIIVAILVIAFAFSSILSQYYPVSQYLKSTVGSISGVVGEGEGGNPPSSCNTGVLIPLYTYPTDSTWQSVINEKNLHPSVKIIVIANPASGSGSSKDNNYVNGIKNMQSAGVIVIGYVWTNYGNRDSNDAKTEISNYRNWYGVNGIFLDGMSGSSSAYYSNLNSYAKSLGMTIVVANPGSEVSSAMISSVDVINIYESHGLGYPSISGCNLATLSYNVAQLDTNYVNTVGKKYGYIYITNDNLPNPWDSLPSYFNSLVASLDTNPITTTTTTTTSTTTTSTTTTTTTSTTSTSTTTKTTTTTTRTTTTSTSTTTTTPPLTSTTTTSSTGCIARGYCTDTSQCCPRVFCVNNECTSVSSTTSTTTTIPPSTATSSTTTTTTTTTSIAPTVQPCGTYDIPCWLGYYILRIFGLTK